MPTKVELQEELDNIWTTVATELNVEDNQEAPVPHEDMDREGGLMGPDGLALNFPFGDK